MSFIGLQSLNLDIKNKSGTIGEGEICDNVSAVEIARPVWVI